MEEFVCVCTPGFAGANCDIDVDECASSPCPVPHDVCVDGINKFSCVCAPGFTGTLCDGRYMYSMMLNKCALPSLMRTHSACDVHTQEVIFLGRLNAQFNANSQCMWKIIFSFGKKLARSPRSNRASLK